ncbi:hypothetical protein [Paenibacillus mendelii]|uniref:Uncharacterized protein n=1 Tax=Paenibacillus mendelii TaxID=206163 RepID=A0ABV6J8P4_9BACL|nr:hypothetical protein [Paenibacillus mendelii]MCQ6559608.1 hypothetical protein [Paenibacillus mendelii]
MFQALIGMDTVLAMVILLFTLLAGYGAGALAYRKTIESIRRTARIILALQASIGILAISEVLLMVYSSSSGWLYVRNEVLLFTLFIALPYAASILFAVPRLIELALIHADYRQQPASRVKRRAAANPWLVVPVQALTVGTMLYTYKLLYPLEIHIYNELSLLGLAYLSVIALLGLRQTVKRKRIHRDDGLSVIHRMKRIGLVMAAFVLLPYGLTYTVIEAQNIRAGNEQVQTEAPIMTNNDQPSKEDGDSAAPIMIEQTGAPFQFDLQVKQGGFGR